MKISNKMKPLLLGLRSRGWNAWDCVCCVSEKPEGTLCIPADQDPRSVFVHKGLIVLDLGGDLTMEHLVLSTNMEDQSIRRL